jgi:hypothetical protein
MTEAAVAPRPDDVADPAAAAPVDAPSAASPSIDESLAEYERATVPAAQTEPAAQPAANYDEIDQLLAELSQPTGPGQSPLFTHGADAHQQLQAQEQFNALQNENAQLRAEQRRAVDQHDFDKLTSQLQQKLPDLPGDYVRSQLLAMAVENPNLVHAFDLRHTDRRAAEVEMRKVEVELQRLSRDPVANQQQIVAVQRYGYQVGLALNSREILRRAVFEVEKRGRSHKPVDLDATADHDAVAAAVRGSSGKASPEPPPNFGAMSDAELRRFTKQNYGF